MPSSRRAAAAAVAFAAWLGAVGAAAAAEPPPQLVAACDACHGPGGNSPTPAIPSIAGQPRRFVENQLVLIREGLRDVPAMKAVMDGVDDRQIVALAQHYAAQPVRPLGGTADDATRSAGAAVSQRALCGTCHLPGYVGQEQVPRLSGQHEDYLLRTMKMYRDKPEPGRDTAMSAALVGLSDADLANLAHYLARHGGK